MANRLDRHVGIIRHVAHRLDTDSASAPVKRVLRTYLNRLQRNAPRRGRGAATGRFVDHVVGVSNRYWPGLFHCYDHPLIPRTSNELEGFFGSSKRGARMTTGRKSTAGGKLESSGPVVGTIQVIDVEAEAAYATVIEGAGFSRGQWLAPAIVSQVPLETTQ